MKREWMEWTGAMVLGLALFLPGCGERRTEEGAPRQSSELAPSPAPGSPEAGGEGTGIPSVGQEQEKRPSGASKEEKKSWPG